MIKRKSLEKQIVVRYESIRGELGLPSLQELWQNCFGIPEKGAECKLYAAVKHNTLYRQDDWIKAVYRRAPGNPEGY